jgi:hypothetical protein
MIQILFSYLAPYLVAFFAAIVFLVYLVNPVPEDDNRTRKVVRNIFNLFMSCLLLTSFWNSVNGPTRKQGMLTEDVSIYSKNVDPKFSCKLPKGVIVTDETPRGINTIGISGDPSMFSITFVTLSNDFVDFSKTDKENFYLKGKKQSNN